MLQHPPNHDHPQRIQGVAVKGNVVDLAVGVIIGAAFGKIVDSLVADIIMPIVGLVFGKLDFSNLYVVLGTAPAGVANTLADLKKAGVPVLAYGNFITIVVNFVILAFIIFMMVKQINRLRRTEEPRRPPRRTARRHRAAARDPRQPQALLTRSAARRGPRILQIPASARAMRSASIRLDASARPLPAISNAVP